MIQKGIFILSPELLMLGITFRESWPDVRNIKIRDLTNSRASYGITISI